jgi:adenylate kinase family enzyme
LAKIVNGLLEFNNQVSNVGAVPKFPSLPLKLCFLGKKSSGKSVICKKFSQQMGLKVLTPDELVQAFVVQAKELYQLKELDETQKDKIRAAERIDELLSTGSPIDDNIIVYIMAEAIKLANQQVEQKQFGGWILDDFPRNKIQAQLLERELTGYEEPKPVKAGNIKRGKQPVATRRKSLIALGAEKELDLNPSTITESCLDQVCLLNVSNELAFQRTSGRRLDPLTNKMYHLEFDPPPSDQPGLVERLVPIDGDASQLQYHMTIFQEQVDEIKDWYSKFQIMKNFDASLPQNEVIKQVTDHVQTIIEKKEKKAAEQAVSPTEGKPSEPVVQPEAAAPVSATPAPVEGAVANPAVTAPATTPAQKKPRPLAKEAAEFLTDQWASLESSYTDTMKFIFRSVRRERDHMIRYFYSVKQNYAKFLTRPDDKQKLVETFQISFNSMEDELRSDIDAKCELHQRALELQDKLWDMTEKRKEEADQERGTIVSFRYLEDHAVFLINYYLAMLQLEMERHIGTKQIVSDYYKDTDGKILDERPPTETTIVSFNGDENPVATEPAVAEKGKKDDKAKKAPPPAAAPVQSPKGARKSNFAIGTKKGGDLSSIADIAAENSSFLTTLLNAYNHCLSLLPPELTEEKKEEGAPVAPSPGKN